MQYFERPVHPFLRYIAICLALFFPVEMAVAAGMGDLSGCWRSEGVSVTKVDGSQSGEPRDNCFSLIGQFKHISTCNKEHIVNVAQLIAHRDPSANSEGYSLQRKTALIVDGVASEFAPQNREVYFAFSNDRLFTHWRNNPPINGVVDIGYRFVKLPDEQCASLEKYRRDAQPLPNNTAMPQPNPVPINKETGTGSTFQIVFENQCGPGSMKFNDGEGVVLAIAPKGYDFGDENKGRNALNSIYSRIANPKCKSTRVYIIPQGALESKQHACDVRIDFMSGRYLQPIDLEDSRAYQISCLTANNYPYLVRSFREDFGTIYYMSEVEKRKWASRLEAERIAEKQKVDRENALRAKEKADFDLEASQPIKLIGSSPFSVNQIVSVCKNKDTFKIHGYDFFKEIIVGASLSVDEAGRGLALGLPKSAKVYPTQLIYKQSGQLYNMKVMLSKDAFGDLVCY
jgi:hypothetical protein